jgi:hypothetical protein
MSHLTVGFDLLYLYFKYKIKVTVEIKNETNFWVLKIVIQVSEGYKR